MSFRNQFLVEIAKGFILLTKQKQNCRNPKHTSRDEGQYPLKALVRQAEQSTVKRSRKGGGDWTMKHIDLQRPTENPIPL